MEIPLFRRTRESDNPARIDVVLSVVGSKAVVGRALYTGQGNGQIVTPSPTICPTYEAKPAPRGQRPGLSVPTVSRRSGDLKTAHDESIGRASESVARLGTLHHTHPGLAIPRATVTREGSSVVGRPPADRYLFITNRPDFARVGSAYVVVLSSLRRLSRSWILAATLVFARSTSMPTARRIQGVRRTTTYLVTAESYPVRH